jgi:hypothetical protein
MIITVYNSTVEEYTYFDAVKWSGTSLKYSIPIPTTQAAESTKLTPSPQAAETIKTGQN